MERKPGQGVPAAAENKMGVMPVGRLLFSMSLPMMISMLVQALYNVVDSMFVARISEAALTALSMAFPIQNLMIAVAAGLGVGLNAVLSRALGAKDEKGVNRAATSGILLLTVAAALFVVGGMTVVEPFFRAQTDIAEIVDSGVIYTRIVMVGSLGLFMQILFERLLQSTGRTMLTMVSQATGAIINSILDPVFIFGLLGAPRMGVAGAALATVIAQGCSVLLCLIYMFRKCPEILPGRKDFVLKKEMTAEMLSQGLALGFMNSIVAAGSVILQYGINGLGYLTIAAHTTARRIFLFCVMPFFSMSMAISTFTSQNRGAGQPERIRKAIRCAAVYNLTVTGVMILILWTGAPALVALISGSGNETVLRNGSLYLRIVAPFFIALGTLSNLRNALQGIGQKLLPVLSSVTECIGKILFVVVLIPRYQYYAVIFCEPVLWCVMMLQLLYSFYRNSYIRTAGKKVR